MDPQTVVSSASLAPYLDYLLKVHGSDLFLTLGVPPSVKVAGIVHPMQLPPLQSGDAKSLAYSVMSAAQISEFEVTQECDLAANIAPYGRFRINVYLQRGEVALVARHISASIPSLEALKLPPILGKLAMEKRGLVLAIGAAGSGKSTTLAAMLDFRNAHARGHILTIEDPIEYLHQHRLSIVEQREVGIDTRSFSDALRHAMREAPDLIMIGEIRDQETMQHAMAYAETGHLCVSTLHANNTNQAIDRILNLYPESARKQVLLDLSLNLRAIIGQRLIPGLKSRLVPAVEVLLQTPYIADLIQKGQIDQIRTAMSKSDEPGIQTFDQSLYTLYSTGEITAEQALENADSKTDLALRIRLQQGSILDGATLGAIDQDATPRR